MAAANYRDKRRSRKAVGKGPAFRQRPATHLTEPSPLIALGTFGALLPAAVCSPNLSFLVAGRYEVRVGNGFDASTLVQLVRTLEHLA